MRLLVKTIDILPALREGRGFRRGLALVLTKALSAGSCFTDRPYCAASPQASHRACPALGLATKKLYTKNLRLISSFSRTEPYGASGKSFRAAEYMQVSFVSG